MARPRIGLVIGQLHRGGAETQLVHLATGLGHGKRLEPLVYCLSGVTSPNAEVLERNGVLVRVLAQAGWRRLRRPLGLRALLRRDGVRIAHAFLLGPSLQTALATLGGGWPVFVASNRTGALARPAHRRISERWALNRACRVTVNSNAALDFTRRYYGVAAERLRYIPNGVGGSDRVSADLASARASLGLPGAARIILGLFRLSPEKDLETFCRVVELVSAEIPGALCLVAGDGPLRAWLEGRVAASDRADRFRLLGPRDDVPSLLAACDLLLHTSRLEGMPNGVLEAMAAGRPVVATRVGGMPDLVEEGVTGHMCPPGDDDGLARACTRLLRDDEERERMGRRARARAGESFGIDRMVQAHQSLYFEILEERR